MPFETSAAPSRRIAVIGAGISGMAAAHLLAGDNAVVLFDADKRLGGHARTLIAGKRGDQPVDTGFIVFNKQNYPHLVRLFDKLDVPVVESDMSFGASIQGGRLEYSFQNLAGIFAQPGNLGSPRYLRMLRDITRFIARSEAMVRPEMTIADLLQALGTGDWFRDYYLLPISGAIWSTPCEGVLSFPAETLVRFFRNHGLMDYTKQHQWFTVRGGSVEYVRRLEAAMRGQGVDLRIGSPVIGVRRAPDGVMVRAEGCEWELFDEVVMATHSDDSLRLLSDATPTERRLLGAVKYQPNEAVLHCDESQMPKRRRAWASWAYCEAAGPRPERIALTYWMNSLQPIPADDPLFVTLNPQRPIRDTAIHDVTTFRHPVFDHGALEAQAGLRAINGQSNTWFCGAWMRHGFHEDGIHSAVEMVTAMGARIPARGLTGGQVGFTAREGLAAE